LALGLCACSTGPAPRPTATYGFSRSPTPDLAQTPAALSPQATFTQPAYPPPATEGATHTPPPYQPQPDTSTPTPDPRILSVAAVPCEPAGDFARCTDPVLGLTFEQPAAWGTITATLRESFAGTGLAYQYQYVDMPGIIQAGGRSADFTEGRGATLTDFSGSGTLGFGSASPEEWCERLAPTVCRMVQPNVLLEFQFPEAEYLCLLPDFYPLESPLAFVWVLLPDHAQINGFVFVSPFLSDQGNEDMMDRRQEILGWDSVSTHTACGAENQAEFDAEIAAYIAELESGQVDPATLANVAALRHLAESITGLFGP
jgi:hypothetical protein